MQRKLVMSLLLLCTTFGVFGSEDNENESKQKLVLEEEEMRFLYKKRDVLSALLLSGELEESLYLVFYRDNGTQLQFKSGVGIHTCVNGVFTPRENEKYANSQVARTIFNDISDFMNEGVGARIRQRYEMHQENQAFYIRIPLLTTKELEDRGLICVIS